MPVAVHMVDVQLPVLHKVRRMAQVGCAGAPPSVALKVRAHQRVTLLARHAIEATFPVALAAWLRLVRRLSAAQPVADAAATFR